MLPLSKRLQQFVHENTWKHRMSVSKTRNVAGQALHPRRSYANRFEREEH